MYAFPDEPVYNRDRFINKILKDWSSCFTLPWEEVRHRMTAISFTGIETWDCDGIISWLDRPLLKDLSNDPSNSFIVQFDDDDWVNPALFPLIRAEALVKKHKALCWDCQYIAPDFSTYYQSPTPSSLSNQLEYIECGKVVENKQEGGIFMGGTYGFSLESQHINLLGQHHSGVFNKLKAYNSTDELLRLENGSYFFRMFNPAGKGWFKATGSIKDAHQLAINQLLFLDNFKDEKAWFYKQAVSYKALLKEIIK
jgi:hypothetical protein